MPNLLLLLLNGICSERALSLRAEGAAEDMAAQVEGLSDDAVSAYACSWMPGAYYVLLSMREEDSAEDMANILEDMLEEQGVSVHLGISDICQDVALLGDARRQAEARMDVGSTREICGGDLPAEDGDDLRMRDIREYVQRHAFDWDLSLANAAADFRLSPAYFSNLLKRANGENFHRYVTRLRMEEACRLLTDTNAPIAEVGARVGYANLSHFRKLFRESVECTPGNDRKTHGKAQTSAADGRNPS